MPPRNVFVTGGTGYVGRHLIARLLARGHSVRALARSASQGKLPPGCHPVLGDALDRQTFAAQVPPADTFVQLVGTSHPSPSKARLFQTVDLASARESIAAAVQAQVRHFVYISVAHPAPVMQAYIAARLEAETLLRESGLSATILRPWYILGPGHRWPVMLIPGYWVCERIPATRDGARRLGLITLNQMIKALLYAVEQPASGTRVLDVPEIRRVGSAKETVAQ